MGRIQFNDGMEVIFEDYNKLGASGEKELYDRVIYELIQREEDAFFSDSFLTSYSSPSQVSVNAGVGFQTDLTQVDPEPTKRLIYRGSASSVNLTAPDLSNDRIDILCVKNARISGATESRKYKAPITDVISNQNLITSNDWEAEFLVVDGTPAGSPAVPATPAGYIKIAELLVSAVTGLSGSGAVTDTRSLMPIGASATINSLAFVRLTQSATLAMQTAFSEVDALLKNGSLDRNDFVDLVSDPAVPAVNNVRLYNKGGLLFIRENGGTVTPVGSGGGGGGGGADWKGDSFETEEFNQKVKEFAQGGGQSENLYVKVPQGYLAGRQIKMFLGHYSPSASDEFKMQTTAYLIRNGLDAIDSVANSHVANSGDIINDQANEYINLTMDLTDAVGLVNGFAVNPGDLLKVVLIRVVPGGTEDTADIRMVPTTTEVKFG